MNGNLLKKKTTRKGKFSNNNPTDSASPPYITQTSLNAYVAINVARNMD